jgi:carbonic anhydrase
MTIPDQLLAGYRQFTREHLAEQAALYRDLSKLGQFPGVMMIACADSRVDPATIFSAGPGQLFVVRNVANLAPPYEEGGGYHGTSAAIEFAVEHLGVQDIVIMGHGQCGGISASLSERPVGKFIAPWVDMISGTRDAVLRENPGADKSAIQQALEFAAIGHSLQNLLSFPFIKSAADAGQLRLHGAWFAIASGELRWRSPDGRFDKIV